MTAAEIPGLEQTITDKGRQRQTAPPFHKEVVAITSRPTDTDSSQPTQVTTEKTDQLTNNGQLSEAPGT